jgi:tRNA G18 (ribose-2'-O)-methylase SpoU
MNIFEITNLRQACEALKSEGYHLLATAADGDISLKDYIPVDKTAVIIGSEGRGIRQSLGEEAEGTLKIDLAEGGIESLNAAQSAAVVFFSVFGRGKG